MISKSLIKFFSKLNNYHLLIIIEFRFKHYLFNIEFSNLIIILLIVLFN